jgi:hypothetical protein
MPKIPKTRRSNDKIILKIFDRKVSGEKRSHNCSICQVYKREIAKGNKDALRFYKDHINEWVKKYNGVTIVLDAKKMPAEALTNMSDSA